MAAADGPQRAVSWIGIGLGVGVWAVALLGALSLAQLPGNWGHAVCGPWGCSGPAQALLACHLAWLLALAPLAWFLASGPVSRYVSPPWIGSLLCAGAIAALTIVVLHERLVWWPAVSESARSYFWQRCGFAVVTTVEIPVVQTLLVGTYLLLNRVNPGASCRARAAATAWLSETPDS